MNCQTFADWLDRQACGGIEHARAVPPARLQEHAARCADCRAALAAVQALEADSVPEPGPLTLPADVSRRQPRRSVRRGLPGGLAAIGLGLGGIVFAAAGWYVARLSADDGAGTGLAQAPAEDGGIDGSPATGSAEDVDAEAALLALVESAERADIAAYSAGILDALPDGEYFSLLRVPPLYPEEAAERGLEGYAISEFTITAEGDVKDVSIVESSDPVFDATTLEATIRQKYKPRVVDGRGVTVHGVRNRFVYRLEGQAEQGADRDIEPRSSSGRSDARPESRFATAEGPVIDHARFAALLEPAYQCMEAGDLRCMELKLDEIMATYALTPDQESRVWHFYGFLHHRRGRYELAIEAYRNATVARAGDGNYMNTRPLMIIAYIHYELQQYQEAMNAASAYLRSTKNPMAVDYVFVEHLRELGAQDPGL